MDRLTWLRWRVPLHFRVAVMSGLLLLIVAAVGAVGIWDIELLQQRYATDLMGTAQALDNLISADRDLYQAQLALERLPGASPSREAQLIAEFKENRQQCLDRVQKHLALATRFERELPAARDFPIYFNQWDQQAQAMVDSLPLDDARAGQMLPPLLNAFGQARHQLDTLEERYTTEVIEPAVARVQHTASHMFGNLAVVTGAGLLVGLLIVAAMVGFIWRGHRRSQTEQAQRRVEAARREFRQRLAQALEMTRSEDDVLKLAETVLTEAFPNRSVEMLLADSSHAHMHRAVSVGYTDEQLQCNTPLPYACPAVARGQLAHFADSSRFEACPFLRDRFDQARCADCAPLSVMGQAVGVISAVGQTDLPMDGEQLDTLGHIASRFGDRIGVLRAFARSEQQAATDPLTGLLNRRSLEEKITHLRQQGLTYALALGDIDHFKQLNDNHGHETGDRALRLFSRVLGQSFGPGAHLCRWGGEEFIALVPGCGKHEAVNRTEQMRVRLAKALNDGSTPAFTVSLGVGDSADASTFEELLARCDEALLTAKKQGRDRVIMVGHAAAKSESQAVA